MKKILVTGSSGFIGSHLVSDLEEKGYDVVGVDIKDNRGFHNVVDRGLAPVADAIIHLAAHAIVAKAKVHPYSTFETNVMGTVNMLEIARRREIPIICASSDKCFGTSKPPYRESTPLRASEPYATSKAATDLICQSYLKTFDVKVVVTRLCNVYGMDRNWSRIVPYLCRELIQGRSPKIWEATMHVKREYLHISDAVGAYVFLLEKLLKGEASGAYNVGSGEVSTPIELFEMIRKVLGSDIDPEMIEEKKDFSEIGNQWMVSSKIHELGWMPKVSLEEGLKQTVKSYEGYLV